MYDIITIIIIITLVIIHYHNQFPWQIMVTYCLVYHLPTLSSSLDILHGIVYGINNH